MKLALAAVLGGKFRVLAAPENINTPVGVARMILANLREEMQVLIVEMGAYHAGDIAELCALTPPDIAVLTGINEAHLERFGSLANTISAKFEIVDNATPEAFVVLNGDDANVMQHAATHLNGRPVEYYGENSQSRYRVGNVRLNTERPGIEFVLTGPEGPLGEFALQHLAPYATGLAQAAAIVGAHLGLTTEELQRGIANITPAPHRLQVSSREGNIITIDDSYNGNPAGAAQAAATLKQFSGRRRIYVTPGLVEMGERAEAVHEELGRQLADSADVVVLVRNSVTPFIAKGLTRSGFKEENIRWFDSGTKAFAAIPNMLKAGDVVLFQNDWPENDT
jgi:UDP-N-acetylmuramoyl-tripeptide--D-alanyl-D-alanine ligase